MKKATFTNLVIRSSLALTLAFAIWSPAPARSAEPAEGKSMMNGKMMERCQEMQEQHKKMVDDAKMEDAQLTLQLTELNRAPEDKKVGLMAALLTEMVEQRITRDARKAEIDASMIKHMGQHMQTGMESMSKCPMMKGMKGVDGSSGDAHKEHQEDPK